MDRLQETLDGESSVERKRKKSVRSQEESNISGKTGKELEKNGLKMGKKEKEKKKDSVL